MLALLEMLLWLRPTAAVARRRHRPAPAASRPAHGSVHGSVSRPEYGPLQGFDAWLTGVMAAWRTPGMAVAVVHKGQVVLCQGYGLRDVKRRLPVTPRTLFGIGSITKSFTVLTLASLAAEGKLDWDRPLSAYLPDLVLWDDAATAGVTARDLVSHRTGLAPHDGIWIGHQTLSRRQLVASLRYLQPERPLRAGYSYNNLMFSLAGHVAERIGALPWTRLLRARVLDPLGMREARLVLRDMQKARDFARPYEDGRAGVTELPLLSRDPGEGGPAGSISASAEDMSRYVRFLLGERPERVLPPADLQGLWQPQIAAPRDQPGPELGAESYGMAWFLTTYRGRRLVWHSGSISGFTAMLALLPDEGIGVVVQGNLGSARLPNAVAWTVLDRLLGETPAPWSERLLLRRRAAHAKAPPPAPPASAAPPAATQPTTRPPRALSSYAGAYTHPAYGTLHIEVDKDRLVLRTARGRRALVAVDGDTFAGAANAPEGLDGLPVRFYGGPDAVQGMALPLEPSVADIRFARAE